MSIFLVSRSDPSKGCSLQSLFDTVIHAHSLESLDLNIRFYRGLLFYLPQKVSDLTVRFPIEIFIAIFGIEYSLLCFQSASLCNR